MIACSSYADVLLVLAIGAAFTAPISVFFWFLVKMDG